MNFIEQILLTIQVGFFFDTHYVIDYAIRNYSDDYIRFVSQYADNETPTLTAHRQFGHQVAKFQGQLVERQSGQSYSLNIHGNGSECALWKRVNNSSL